jgi:hypothetical protein
MSTPTTLFIERWQQSAAAERANYALFLSELCDLLDVPRPQPHTASEQHNAYVFEKPVPTPHGTTGFIDLYKRGCFVLEAKQGSDKAGGAAATFSEAALQQHQRRKAGTAVRGTMAWDTAMEKARQQAQSYARNLPADEIRDGRPPLLLIVDVGNSIALYSEFTRTGGHYIPFPDPHSYRLSLDDLHDANIRALLRQVWLDPMSLDPSRRAARVTREIADRLAKLARSLENAYDPETVAHFLMRCLFTMFAEDVGLLPKRSFAHLLADIRQAPESFQPMMEHLWGTMNTGGFSVILRQPIPQFNGGLFAEPSAIPLNPDQIQLLAEAAQADWRDVEPAIFGTLLERALSPQDRHKLGAHYTPRAYVERLVKPTVIEPLRAEWEGVQVAAAQLAERGQIDKAIAEVATFHRRLASVKILDPACGSGNFLYVTLEHLKRLEGEILNTLRELGQGQMMLAVESVMVTPRQLLGIEVNPRAAAIAELVLWIGFLQWHIRTRGEARPPEPILKNEHNIECRDAVLAWDGVEPLLTGDGQPVTRWDGRTVKRHPITGEDVPDETARVPAYRYLNPRPATWPQADFIVGNPPFIGTSLMRLALGDGYTETIRQTYPAVPESADYVMYWWHKAAELTRQNQVQRFGFITTNSLRQTFNRRVLQHHLAAANPLALTFAIPDHPWVDSADGAAVRIAMTVAQPGEANGRLQKVISEKYADEYEAEVQLIERQGKIQADLTIGANVVEAKPLQANQNLSSRGMQLIGSGFIVTQEEAKTLGFGRIPGLENHIRKYRHGRDLTATPRGVMVIDLFGLSEEEVREKFPEVYQWVLERVKPERDQNRDKKTRESWWLHGRPREELRDALQGLNRYIATVETAKHRFFILLDESILPDNRLVNFAFEDAYFLGVLSSRVHVTWTLAAGGTLEDRPIYNKTRCFETFPFPDATPSQQTTIRALAEQLDAHRKRQQTLHPTLTLTDLYNVLEKARQQSAGQHFSFSAKEKQIYEQGLVAILQQLHDDLDAAVFAAYGWPATLTDEEILERLVALNSQRTLEEANGHIRWLRPEYQTPETVRPQQTRLLPDAEGGEEEKGIVAAAVLDWPVLLKEQAQAVRAALSRFAEPVAVSAIATCFSGKPTPARLGQITALLETLAALGQAQETPDGRFAPLS